MPPPSAIFKAATNLLVNITPSGSPIFTSPSFTRQGGVKFAIQAVRYISPIGNRSLTSFIDSAGATWTFLSRRGNGISGIYIELWYTNGLTAASRTFQYTFDSIANGLDKIYTTIVEYSNMPSGIILGNINTGISITNPTISTDTAVITSDNNQLEFIALSAATATSLGAFSGSFAGGTARTSADPMLMADRIPAQSLNAIGTIVVSAAEYYTMVAAAFRGSIDNSAQPAAPIATPFTMDDSVVFALPPNRVLVTVFVTGGTLQVSNDQITWQTVNLNTNKSAFLTARFMQMSGGTAVANVKQTKKQK